MLTIEEMHLKELKYYFKLRWKAFGEKEFPWLKGRKKYLMKSNEFH